MHSISKKKAGCVPVRRSSDGMGWHVLLVRSTLNPSRWLFPKGSVEADETTVQAAQRETREEGGVIGQLGPKLGSWHCHRGQRVATHSMWLLFVHTEHGPDCDLWMERHRRIRRWYSFDGAKQLLNQVPCHLRRPELFEMLAAAFDAVNAVPDASPVPFGMPAIETARADDDHDSDLIM